MPIFKSKAQDDIGTVTAKLADAQSAVADLERQLSDRALAAALDEPGADEAVGFLQNRIAAGRARVELLESALGAAHAAERQRLAKARAEADQSRVRSLRQHVAILSRAALAYQVAQANAVQSYRDMVAEQDAITKLARADERDLRRLTSRGLLDRLCHLELSRVGAVQPLDRSTPNVPGADWSRTRHGEFVRHGQMVCDVAPLVDQLRSRFDSALAIVTGSAAPPVPPPPPITEPAPVEPAETTPLQATLPRKRGAPEIFSDDRALGGLV